MRISTIAALMIITTVLLSACTQQQAAQLDDRSHMYYGRNGGTAIAQGATYQAAPLDSISTNSNAPSISTPVHATGHVPFGGPTPAPGGNAAMSQAPTLTFTSSPSAAPAAVATNEWEWPVTNGRVITRFGKQGEGIANEGISIAAPDGAAIHAASAGEVAYVGENVRDYGSMVILRHPNGELTSYAHAKQITVLKGDKVASGQTIGYVGQTGNVKSPQLHFALREGDHAIDPLSKFPSQMASR